MHDRNRGQKVPALSWRLMIKKAKMLHITIKRRTLVCHENLLPSYKLQKIIDSYDKMLILRFLQKFWRPRCLIFIVNKRKKHESTSESGQFLTICYRTKQIDVSFSCVCPVVVDDGFRHNVVKVVRSAIVNPQTTFTMLWRNSWSKTGQTHENLRQFVNLTVG